MVELDAGLSAQLAVAQQRATIGMMKQAADIQQKFVEMLTETVTASNKGRAVDLRV